MNLLIFIICPEGIRIAEEIRYHASSKTAIPQKDAQNQLFGWSK